MSTEIRDFLKNKLSIASDQDISEKSLTNGRSGAEVYSIKVQSRRNRLSGYYIVKVCNTTAERNETEVHKAQQLYSYSPEFSSHLVKVEAYQQVGGRDVIIYRQANDSRISSTAFSLLDGERLAKYTRRASCEVLTILNADARIGGTVEDFFKCLLAKQLAGSRFKERMEALLDRPDAQCVAINSIIYPNPFYYMRHIEGWQDCLSDIHLFKGVSHGDMHGLNLIASDDTYCMIDFDSTEINSYLLFDQAYFEFSTFYDNIKDNDLKRWALMLEKLISPSVFKQVDPCEYYLEYTVRNAICGGIADWVKTAGLEKQQDDIAYQFLMARIAAGINFFCKKTCADQGKQVKVLLFIAQCLKLLLHNINFSYDENDISSLLLPSEFTDTETLWEDFLKFTNYTPVLITDDLYTDENYSRLKGLCTVRWSMMVDVGVEQKEPALYKFFLENMNTQSVKRVDILASEGVTSTSHTLNVLSTRKPVGTSYSVLWRTRKKQILKSVEKLLSDKPQIPLIFIFDCGKDALPFRNQLVNSLCDLAIPAASRFVSLRARFSDELRDEMAELETSHRWHFIEHTDITMAQVAQCCRLYLGETAHVEHSANLPSLLEGIHTFSNKDLINFASSIELVYDGCEYASENDDFQMGFDGSGSGDSLGEAFYKGDEATWNDISNHRDLCLLDDTVYQRLQSKLLKMADETSPRVRMVQLLHGAGTGGTTLAKRILWDLKDSIPCVWLKKHSPKTANMLLEIYQRTGKRVLLGVEQGSTVISDDDLHAMIQQIDSENGKLLLLLISRSDESTVRVAQRDKTDNKKENSNVIARLTDTMPVKIANKFYHTFSTYAKKKTDASQRIKLLKNITGDDQKDQRSPFFYGFYTFQEEYNLLGSLKRTISSCSDEEKTLLNSLALITIYSQNICISFSELRAILGLKDPEGIVNFYAVLEELPSALSKLIVVRKNAFRLCHRIIAERVLLLLHDPNGQCTEMKCVLKQAAMDYIKVLYKLYDGSNERVDGILRELIIDRAYIDSDAQKTKFSPLVETIPQWTERKSLFKMLIDYFPENPHYYNHMARLMAFEDKKNQIFPQYKEAVTMAEKAIQAAVDTGNPVSIHRTTLGYIYGQWIVHTIRSEISNKKLNRFAPSYDVLIDNIKVHYSLAREEFEKSREEAEVHDSFSYFPQINMECSIIQHLVKFDQGRSLEQLVEQEPAFKAWYDEHFSIAVELTIKMKNRVDINAQLLDEAQNKLQAVAKNSNRTLKNQLNKLLHSNTVANRQRSRTLAYTAFTVNGCSWSKLEQDTLELAEQCFRRNFREPDGSHYASDVETWFDLYRRCRYFQAAEAQSLIVDYMEDGFRKEYLLFLIGFTLLEAGASGASAAAMTTHVAELQRQARLHGINTARERDCFVDHCVGGCPIVSMADIDRNDAGEPVNLQVFTGRVIEVEQTHGKILLDHLNMNVTFIPNPASVNSDPQRVFKREDVNCPVKLNLMFSYSGLRGWNVVKY